MLKKIISLLVTVSIYFSGASLSFAQMPGGATAQDVALLISSVKNDKPINPKAIGVVSALGGLSIIYALKSWTNFMEAEGYKYARSGAGSKELERMLSLGHGGLAKSKITSLDFKLSEIIREFIDIKFDGMKLSVTQKNALMDDIFRTFQKKGINLFTHAEMFEGKVVQGYSFMVQPVVEKQANMFAKERYYAALKGRTMKAGIASLAVIAVSAVIYFALPKDNSGDVKINNTRIALQRAMSKVKADDPALFTLYICSLPEDVQNTAYAIIAEDGAMLELLRRQISEVNSPEYKILMNDLVKAENATKEKQGKIKELKTGFESRKNEGYKSASGLFDNSIDTSDYLRVE